MDGSVDDTCDADGKCTCKEHIAGDKCDEAEPGYYEFPDPTRKIFYIFKELLSFLWILSKIRSIQASSHLSPAMYSLQIHWSSAPQVSSSDPHYIHILSYNFGLLRM